MDYQHLQVQRGQIYTVTFNRPERMNALAPRTLDEVSQVCSEFNEDREARVMVVNGNGEKAFSTGIDLREMAERNAGKDIGFDYAALGDWSQYGFLQADKPVVAAIHGYCMGGGFEMALACDIRIAADTAVFAMPESRVGVSPGSALVYLARMMPIGEALHLMLTGDRMSAQEAHRLGLVHEVVARAELMDKAMAAAQKIAEGAPLAIQAIKRAVRDTTYVPPELAARLLDHILIPLGYTQDAKEGPKAFAEKRKPQWQGR